MSCCSAHSEAYSVVISMHFGVARLHNDHNEGHRRAFKS